MKKIILALAVLVSACAAIVSCSKDDEILPDNSITITGTFTVGDKTYTNPTFDLGGADEHEAYLATFQKNKQEYNTVVINNVNEIMLGSNNFVTYNLQIYSAVPASNVNMYAHIGVYPVGIAKVSYLSIYGDNAKAKITKIGEVGGYIYGSYEGEFVIPGKTAGTYYVKGKFKVKRINEPVK